MHNIMDYFFPTALILAIVIGFPTIIILTNRAIKIQEELDASFIEIIQNCLANETLSSLNDLHVLFCAQFKQSKCEICNMEGLSNLVHRTILEMSAAKNLKDNSNKLALLKSFLPELEERIKKEKIRAPFSDVPTQERQLLEDILELTATDKDIVRTKLSELGKSICIREDSIKRLGRESHESLIWAKLGIAGTVIFSVISIALAISPLIKAG